MLCSELPCLADQKIFHYFVVALRNRISHAYFGIDYGIVWDIIINNLPENKAQIEKVRIDNVVDEARKKHKPDRNSFPPHKGEDGKS